MLNRIRTIRKSWLVVTAAAALMAVGLTAGAVFAAGSPQRHFDGNTSQAMKTYPASGTHHASQEQFIARVARNSGHRAGNRQQRLRHGSARIGH